MIKPMSVIKFPFILFIVCLFFSSAVPEAHATYINMNGFETGDTSEIMAVAPSAGFTAQSAVKRTGSYAGQANLSGIESHASLAAISSTGVQAAMGRAAATYYTFYFRIGTLPSVDSRIATVTNTAGSRVVGLNINNAGALTFIGSTTVAVATLSTGQWYRIEIMAVTNGTSEVKIDGGTPVTVTGMNITQDYFYLGPNGTTVTYNMYYDDVAINNSGYTGAGQVNILKPNAVGAYSAWTGTYTDVDEVPHDSDTTYITATGFQVETVALDSATTGGVSGSIGTVKSLAVVRGEAGTHDIQLRTRSGSTDQDTTTLTLAATYTSLAKLNDTDPADSSAWTSSDLDSLEVGVEDQNVGAIGSSLRATAMYSMVWSSPSAPTVSNDAVTSITSTTAILNSTVNPNGASTNITYWYDTSNISCNFNSASLAGPSGLTGASPLSGATTQQSISGLSPNTTYYVCASANNSIGNVAASGRVSFTTSAGIPVLSARSQTGMTNTAITLGATVSSDGGAAISSRGVCYAKTADDTTPGFTTATGSTPEANVTCVTTTGTTGLYTVPQITGLLENTAYTYRGFARNAVGNGYSATDAFTTYAPPSTTTSAATSLATNSAILNSTINPNGASTNVSYLWGTTADVSCALQPNTLAGPTALTGTANLSGATTQATLSSLSANKTYYFCVMATNTYGTTYGAVTSLATSATPGAYTMMDAGSALGGGATDCYDTSAAPCPPTPGAVSAASATSVTVTWSAATGPAATSYTVTCVSGGACSNTNRGTQSSGFTDSGLTCGTSYTYKIFAVNASGTSTASSNFSGSTGSCATPPSTPTNFTATVASAGQVNLSWTASATGTAPINYVVQRCLNNLCTVADYTNVGTATSYSNTSLTCNQYYGYAVYATNAGGNSAATGTLYRLTSACPSQVTGVTATASPGGNGTLSPIILNWSSAANATQYYVYWCSGSNCTPTNLISVGNVFTYKHVVPTCNTSYRYYVVGVNAGGTGPASTTTGNVTVGAPVTCYTDADADGYAPSGASPTSLCGGSCTSGYTSTQPTTTGSSGNTDCYDGNSSAYPGSTNGGVGFGGTRGDGSADYNCDGIQTYGSGGSGGSYCNYYEQRYYNPGTCSFTWMCPNIFFAASGLACGNPLINNDGTYTTYSDSFCSVTYGSASLYSNAGSVACY